MNRTKPLCGYSVFSEFGDSLVHFRKSLLSLYTPGPVVGTVTAAVFYSTLVENLHKLCTKCFVYIEACMVDITPVPSTHENNRTLAPLPSLEPRFGPGSLTAEFVHPS